MKSLLSSCKRFVVDERGVALILGAMLAGIVVPVGVTAFYLAQLRGSHDILDTVCQGVLAAGISVQNPLDRDAALKEGISGLIDQNVLEVLVASMNLTAGSETYKKGDPETDRPEYELTLRARDLAGRSGSSLGEEVGVKCKAKLEYGKALSLVEEKRRIRFLAGEAPYWERHTGFVPIPGWGEAKVVGATKANPPDIRLYVEREINGEKFRTEVWRRKEAHTDWLHPTDTDGDGVWDDTRMTGTFVDNSANAALLNDLAATHLVELTVDDPNRTRTDTRTGIGGAFPAIKPVCFDKTDPNDPGLGWEIDPDLLPGGSRTGEMGTIHYDLDYKHIAVVGVGVGVADDGSLTGKYKDDYDWDKWDVRVSVDGGATTHSAKGKTAAVARFTPSATFKDAAAELEPNTSIFGSRNYQWKLQITYDGRTGIQAYLREYELFTTVMCPGEAWERQAVPIPTS